MKKRKAMKKKPEERKIRSGQSAEGRGGYAAPNPVMEGAALPERREESRRQVAFGKREPQQDGAESGGRTVREPLLRVWDLAVGYDSKTVVSGLNLSLPAGRILCFLGPNGGGKSTILRTLAGMQPPLKGGVEIAGAPVGSYHPRELARILSVVLTEPLQISMTTALEVVLMGRTPFTGFFGKPSRADREIALHALESVGALALANRDVSGLSDGEKQKIMIARALAQQPKIVILDEPTSHLDIKHRLEVMEILKTLAREHGVAVVLALHDIDIALKTADEIVLLRSGEAVFSGAAAEAVRSVSIEQIYGISNASYHNALGIFEVHNHFPKRVWVISRGESGVPVYRLLSRLGIGAYITGPKPGDLDFAVACAMKLEPVECSEVPREELDLIICTDPKLRGICGGEGMSGVSCEEHRESRRMEEASGEELRDCPLRDRISEGEDAAFRIDFDFARDSVEDLEQAVIRALHR